MQDSIQNKEHGKNHSTNKKERIYITNYYINIHKFTKGI